MKKLKGIITIFLLLLFLATYGCGAGEKESTKASKVVINGSTTVFPIAQRAAEEFMNKYPDVNVSVRGTGSGNGIASLINGTCDIADASRPITQGEIEEAEKNGIKPVSHIIARDGIAIIVNKDNPISSISRKELKKIYTGEITNWKELGGEDMKIIPVTRDSSSGTFEVFEEKVLGKDTQMISSAVVQGSNQAVKVTVTKTPGAIGYIGLGYIDGSVKVLRYDGIIPSEKSVSSGAYEISRPLFMYTNGQPVGVVKEFIDFVLSKDGQKIVKEAGFVPVAP